MQRQRQREREIRWVFITSYKICPCPYSLVGFYLVNHFDDTSLNQLTIAKLLHARNVNVFSLGNNEFGPIAIKDKTKENHLTKMQSTKWNSHISRNVHSQNKWNDEQIAIEWCMKTTKITVDNLTFGLHSLIRSIANNIFHTILIRMPFYDSLLCFHADWISGHGLSHDLSVVFFHLYLSQR